MKYITLIIGLLVVGCGGKPAIELTLEEKKVVGTYEAKIGEDTFKLVFLETALCLLYDNGNKEEGEAPWKIVDGELHVEGKVGGDELERLVYRINKDNSITIIAIIDEDGKRTDSAQGTFIKIK